MADSRKRKNKSFYKSNWKRSNWAEELKPNIQGFIITCNCNEKQTVQECYRLLNEYADKRYGPEISEETNESDEDVDVDKALKKEVDEIKKMKDTQRRFTSVKNKAKNVIFIKTTLPDPSQLSFDIYSDILSSQVRKTKFCLRLLPVITTCYAKFDHIITTATPLIEKFFHQSMSPFTFCIMWKVRCNNLLKKDEVVSRLVEIIYSEERGHTTDYNSPKYVFNLDIIGNVCCFGFLEDYQKFKKYNLDMIVAGISSNVEKSKNVPQVEHETCNIESSLSTTSVLTLESIIPEDADSISLGYNKESSSNDLLIKENQVNIETNKTC